MLGLTGNAVKSQIRFAPQLPFSWEKISAHRFQLGTNTFDFIYKNNQNFIQIECNSDKVKTYNLSLAPFLPLGSIVQEVKIDGIPTAFKINSTAEFYQCEVNTTLSGRRKIEIFFKPGVAIEPPVPDVNIGDSTHGLKVINHRYENNMHTILVEGNGCFSADINASLTLTARFFRRDSWLTCADDSDIHDLRAGARIGAVGDGGSEFVMRLQGRLHPLFQKGL